MTNIDWIAAGVIAISALIGLRRGLIGGLLGLAGIVVGAYIGAKLAPEFLPGSDSPYTPLVALAGAAVLVILFQSIASMAGSAIRTSLFVLPPLRWLDSLGGLVLGAVAGVAIVWVMGAVALHLPGQRELREEVQRSRILGEINARVPPSRLLDAIARVDPFSRSAGPRRTSRRPIRRCWRARPSAPPATASSGSSGAPAASASQARAGRRRRTSSSRTRTSSPG